MAFKHLSKLKTLLSSSNQLSSKVKKNIAGLAFIKGYSILISFLLIPFTLEILGDYKYGVWITIFNMLSMMQILDIGIGNGLRNMLTIAIANNDIKKAREYVSTAYIVLGIITLIISLGFIIPWYNIDWIRVFNANLNLRSDLENLILVSVILTTFSFFFGLINIILISYHKAAYASSIIAISNTFVFLILIVFKESFWENIFLVGFVYCLTPIIVTAILSFWLFTHSYKDISPSFSFFNTNKVKEIISLGGKFFIIQISILVIFQSDSIIISHFLNPSEVTPYSVVYKYFSIITTIVALILTPFWAAYSEAYSKKQYDWIRMILKKQFKYFFGIIFLVLIMLFASRYLIEIWVGNRLVISLSLIISMAVFTIINVWNIIICTFLNGINKIKVQLVTCVLGLIINIPLSIFFVKIYGVGGVLMATSVSLLFTSVFCGMQVFKILKTLN